MSDEGKDKKNSKRTLRIKYVKCSVCGGRKQEQNMVNEVACIECYEKQNQRRDSFWKRQTNTRSYGDHRMGYQKTENGKKENKEIDKTN